MSSNTPAVATQRNCARCKAPMPAGNRFCELCGSPSAATTHDAAPSSSTGVHTQSCDARERIEVRAGRSAGITDRGLRHRRNEDALELQVLDPSSGAPAGATVCVVCDGVSAAPRSDEASAAAATTGARDLAAALQGGADGRRATEEAARCAAAAVGALFDPAEPDRIPACTYVSVVLQGGLLNIGWVGDSRAYWIPDSDRARAAKLTEDDSWLSTVTADGAMSLEQAGADHRAHAITGWLGADNPRPRTNLCTMRPVEPGVVVVCTDGLWKYMSSPTQLSAALPGRAAQDTLAAAQQLVRVALRCGGRDNITVAILPVDVERQGVS